ncbi:hypothetical protein LARI1_G009009 [Lachnellula arida]|uniref:Uncharacterized protein n=1 Tax=Lachnellula arida TaxID=1316785 RepID=A0A8T9B5K1_9HELO|nr:hypothetical protein LARI1_G009009 [Lachnellula arida]
MAASQVQSSTTKNRWGVTAKPYAGVIDSLQWEDFDHTQTLCLGYSGSTCIVYQKNVFNSFVLRYCPEESYTQTRSQLVAMARVDESKSFLSTNSVFKYSRNVYVASELSDMSLEDIIDCTIPLQENHVSSILAQIISTKFSPVTSAICMLHENSSKAGISLIYGSLQASNIFISRDGIVKLGEQIRLVTSILLTQVAASFGTKVAPEKRTKENWYRDCRDLGALANHMISRCADEFEEEEILQQKMISLSSSGNCLDVQFEPSPQLVDFLELCFSGSADILKIAKVGHTD